MSAACSTPLRPRTAIGTAVGSRNAGSMQQRREVQADEIRPDDERQQPLPERKLQVADREQPAGDPDEADGAVLLDTDLFHAIAPGWLESGRQNAPLAQAADTGLPSRGKT